MSEEHAIKKSHWRGAELKRNCRLCPENVNCPCLVLSMFIIAIPSHLYTISVQHWMLNIGFFFMDQKAVWIYLFLNVVTGVKTNQSASAEDWMCCTWLQAQMLLYYVLHLLAENASSIYINFYSTLIIIFYYFRCKLQPIEYWEV